MDRQMMSLGRAKKKLRYFQSEERTSCHLKINNVFSMQDLDNIFDDLDSHPATPLLSPMPKSKPIANNGSQLPVLKSPIAFRGQIGPRKGSDVLASEADIQMSHLNDEGSPFEEIAPIKTSSPIELLTGEVVAEDAEKPDTFPLLFGIEDEEPVSVDMSKLQMNQTAESAKDTPERDSESLASPPIRLEFRKSVKQTDALTSSTPLKAPEARPSPDKVSKTSQSEEQSQRDGRLSLTPKVLIQKCQPERLPEEHLNKQVQETPVDVGVKQSLFKKKLINVLQPNTSCFRKEETLKETVRAPSPHVQEEDFMILEDYAPIRFTIARKPKRIEKPAPESRYVEPDLKEKVSPEHTDEVRNHNDEPKNKTKVKHGKTVDVASKDTAVQSAPEEQDEVSKGMEDGEQICLSPDTNQDADAAGKQRPKGKASKPKHHVSKDRCVNVDVKIPAEMPPVKTKKSIKLPASTNTEHDEPVSNVGKKPIKIKPASESTGLSSVKSKKHNKDRRAVKNKMRDKERVAEMQNHTEPPPSPAEQPEAQGMSAANKEHTSKQRAPKKTEKVKTKVKMKNMVELKELPVSAEPGVSEEASATSKRKRKPPGEWWLTQNSEDNTQEHQEEFQASLELKSNRKKQKKAQGLTDTEEEVSTASQEIQKEPVTVPKPTKKVKKTQADKYKSNPAESRKNPKAAGGRGKPKSGAQDQREMTPGPVVEEVRDDEAPGQLSPLACSPLPRQRHVTPGDKGVFPKSYTREGIMGSAQKSPLHKNVPVKRQRRQPRNFWEVPQSQEPVKSSQAVCSSSAQTSRPQMDTPKSLQKTHGQKKKNHKMINTPKPVKRSLATFDAIYDSGKPSMCTERGQGDRQKGRRNLLHSLEEQSGQSSEDVNCDYQQQVSSHATFDVCVSGVPESSGVLRKINPRPSGGSNRGSYYDLAFKSGPSSLIVLERYEEHDDFELPIIAQKQCTPRVISDCDLCGPPLKPIVLDNEDRDNLCVWFAHIWPTLSKDGKSISPDDFHWHSHAGRAMGHMIDLQSNDFSSGKILLGSYMKKPAHVDLDAVTVFNVASSCVRVEMDDVKEVYNSGHTFMTPCGKSYTIHNMCQEPAILWYHRMLPSHTRN